MASNHSDFIVAEHVFKTSDVPTMFKEAYWRDEVLSNIGNTHIQRLDSANFDSRIHLKAFSNELLIANTFYGSHQLSRSQKQINTSDDGFFVLGAMVQGGISFKQKTVEFSKADKGLLFYYAQSPFDIIFHNCEDMLVKIPEHVLLPLLPTAKDMPALLFTAKDPYYQLIYQFMQTLYSLPNRTSYLQGVQIRDALLQSLAVAISHHLGSYPTKKKLDSYHYQKTLLFLKKNYHNDKLDNATIANAMNLSVGHLQKIFAKMDTSIMHTLWKIRLERASQLLLSEQASQYDLCISDVAFRCGFKTSSHFSREFRKHTGMTPSLWISQHTSP